MALSCCVRISRCIFNITWFSAKHNRTFSRGRKQDHRRTSCLLDKEEIIRTKDFVRKLMIHNLLQPKRQNEHFHCVLQTENLTLDLMIYTAPQNVLVSIAFKEKRRLSCFIVEFLKFQQISWPRDPEGFSSVL